MSFKASLSKSLEIIAKLCSMTSRSIMNQKRHYPRIIIKTIKVMSCIMRKTNTIKASRTKKWMRTKMPIFLRLWTSLKLQQGRFRYSHLSKPKKREIRKIIRIEFGCELILAKINLNFYKQVSYKLFQISTILKTFWYD